VLLLLLHVRKEDFRELAQVSCGSVWKGAGLVKTDNDLLTIKKIKRERKCCRGNWGEKKEGRRSCFGRRFLAIRFGIVSACVPTRWVWEVLEGGKPIGTEEKEGEGKNEG
jgi:hypothetical protein